MARRQRLLSPSSVPAPSSSRCAVANLARMEWETPGLYMRTARHGILLAAAAV
ncbi:MAG: hypothetical protein AVDCRST_MAG19-858 [uncultured Thermomicrobiales bacterium]|uniref:Uncharacterized protein n=1 Tax=uncultured Thermomicrobiales bacterium TaxID=1645740 RepID=A0A6J4UJM5_9BACT|nr:MAG: hypothetical protein AVDCRST_MAG19-858 [uncultured Thermomicrobiales bacterium]